MIYLDNNATTPIAAEVMETMAEVAESGFGNPGSRHIAGRKARQILEDAREQIACFLDASPDEVVFTSGGTESSNLAVNGLTSGRTGLVVLPPGEHPATSEPVKRLQQRGCRRHKLRLTNVGQLEPDSIQSVPWDEAILTTAILAHNETGTILDLSMLAMFCEQNRVPLHVDAVQAVGKIPVSFRELQASTLSLGAHKFHGPRGIGALLIRNGVKVSPQIFGGFQEQGRRAGTEPVMLVAGMARALAISCENLQQRHQHLMHLRDRLESGLRETCSPVVVNGDSVSRLPNTLNLAFPGCDADALLVAMDLHGICCSHGSACASGSSEPAPILLGMRCPPEVYQSSLRFSVGVQNTDSEIDDAIQIISQIVQRLRNVH